MTVIFRLTGKISVEELIYECHDLAQHWFCETDSSLKGNAAGPASLINRLLYKRTIKHRKAQDVFFNSRE